MTKQQTIERIAREILDLETLETRRMDSLDFKEQAVWSIAKALDAAYEAGRLAGRARRRGDDGPGFRIGQRVRVTPLGEAGRIKSAEDDHLVVVDLDSGGPVHVPIADCKPITRRQRP